MDIWLRWPCAGSRSPVGYGTAWDHGGTFAVNAHKVDDDMNRRRFLRGAGLLGAGLVAGAVPVTAAAKAAGGKKTRWRMVLAWTVDMELFKRGAIRFARQVSLLSESRLAIDVSVAPPGASPADVLAMVERGEADCAHAFAHTLAHREPAMEWFSRVPFGMAPDACDAWLYDMGGKQLWKDACLPFGFYPRPMGDTGPLLFGWSRRELGGMDDFRGLGIPAGGVAAHVLKRAGARPVPEADGPPTVAALARGDLDCAAWHGPFHEREQGFHKAASRCYAPGWQAPGGRMMLCLNRASFEAVPAIIRIIINAAAAEEDHRLRVDFAAYNARALARLRDENAVIPQRLPRAVLDRFRAWSMEAASDLAAASPLSRLVRDSYLKAARKFPVA